MSATPWSRVRIRESPARQGPVLSHPSPFQRDAELAASATARADPRLGGQPFLLSDQHSASRMPRSSPTATTGWSGASWVQRILDHDGYGDDPGGIESWLRLADAVGLERSGVEGLTDVLPGVRFAVDAYVNFARGAPWHEAACAALTELFAPQIHRQRLAGWPEHYPWIDRGGLRYFQSRVSLARSRCRFCARGHARALSHAGGAGAGARNPAVQARCALADE